MRFAASSSVRRREFTLYVDESIYSKDLVSGLLLAKEDVRRVGIDVKFGAKDHEWLEVVGTNGWFALTRDQRIRYRTLEKRTMKAYEVGAFTFIGGQATASQTTARVLELLPKMKAIAKSETRPFLYTFGHVGGLARVSL
ncbi:MAG: hypothetical protein ACREVI_02725 [Steroidobacteraceae bacterium]